MIRRLFLASAFGDVAEKLPWGLLDHANKLRVGFVITAANPYPDAWWQNKDRKKLCELGFVVEDIDIEGKDQGAIRDIFRDIDVIFVAGGNTFYLLYHARKSSFGVIVKECIDLGKVYIGSSAGSVIMGPTLDPIHEMDLDEAEMVHELKSYEAFHIIDTVILPHTGDEFGANNEKAKEEFSDRGYPILLLTDKQALVVDGDTQSIIET